MNELSNIYDNIKKYIKCNYIAIIYIILIIIICLIHSYSVIKTIDFSPINGTFQNFNVVKRFIDGQIPFKDFSVYLGVGHLFVGSVFTIIFGNNFSGSMIGFTFLSIITLCLLSIIIGKTICGRKSNIPYATTLILLLLLLVNPSILSYIESNISYALTSALSTGNSARFLRGMAIIFIISISYFALYILKRINKKYDLQVKTMNNLKLTIMSVISGITFIWSNDYGIACWVCSIIMLTLLTYFYTRKISKSVITLLKSSIISIITIIISITIITRGNILSWYSSLFNTGGAQTWYYGHLIDDKVYYLFDINLSFLSVSIAFICLFCLYKIYKNYTNNNYKYTLIAYITMVSFAAINEYRLLSGGNLIEIAYSILFLIFTYYIIYYFYNQVTNKKILINSRKIIVIISLILIINKSHELLLILKTDNRGEYVEELGGYLKDKLYDVTNTKLLIGDEKIFSTYASALETVTNQYQPSGTDYIIHALGNDSRENYINTFKEGNFKYVTTISENYSEYEYWIKNANWFFYRELYKDYIPTYSNSYQVLWQKNNDYNNVYNENIVVNVVELNPGNILITLETDEYVNGIADLKIDYTVKKNGTNLSKLILNKMIYLSNIEEQKFHSNKEYSNWFLRESSEEFIPVTIVNGTGSVNITSVPEKTTTLDINSVNCESIFTTYFDYIEISNISKLNNKVTLEVLNIPKNLQILDNSKTIMINDIEYTITDKIYSSDYYKIVLDTTNYNEINETLKIQNIFRMN